MQPKGVDVLGLILGKTDTPALRKLEAARGVLASEDTTPPDAASVESVVATAFENLANGPTCLVGPELEAVGQLMGAMPRNDAVKFIAQAITASMGE